ncbi:MAG TPA: LTA synthase family protein [Vicinamibacterales bacterium]|nr:LTA synthase family protein [Vicinamibacterales bacterium]
MRSLREALAGRFYAWAALAAAFVVVATATRVALVVANAAALEAPWRDAAPILGIGLVYDLAAALYLLAPFACYLWLVPERVFRTRAHRALLAAATAASFFGMLYLAPVEWFFFEEFNARFNQVAVDYLVSPREVFVNIWESYPVAAALAIVAAATLAAFLPVAPALVRSLRRPTPFASRTAFALVLAALLAPLHFGLDASRGQFSHNRIANELAQDGPYSFFAAALNSKDLDYRHFYAAADGPEAAARLRRFVDAPNVEFIQGAPSPIARRVHYAGAPRPLHVVVLLQESLGAEFVGAYGDTRGLTPNIDRLAAGGIVFRHTYATGTRTVRGMEAVTASFPPVPAESIVKRRGNESLFNWAEVMRAAGYSPTFLYGGFGTFDNMNYYFGHNGYRVIDRLDMDAPKFANIWGVSDEDLFRNAVRVFDEQHARGERIFSVVMSTSNHKPFTFPDGVPGVPAAGGGRLAGIRYADYAIGRFIDAARARPWFRDTVFVVVADHGARVYGREDIPLRTYEIPFIVYAPAHFAPRRVDTLTSQLDVAPTVLGLLGISHDSMFFGSDVLAAPSGRRLVPLIHNRDIGLYDGEQLTVLHFRKATGAYAYDRAADRQIAIAPDPERVRDAASVFATAYDLFVHRAYAWQVPPRVARAGAE